MDAPGRAGHALDPGEAARRALRRARLVRPRALDVAAASASRRGCGRRSAGHGRGQQRHMPRRREAHLAPMRSNLDGRVDRPGASALHDRGGELGRHLGRARDVPGAAHDDGSARLGHEDRARLPVPRRRVRAGSTRRCGRTPARPAPASPIRHRGRAPRGARAVPRARRRPRRRSARASPRPPRRAAGPRRRAPRCRRRRRRAPGRRRTARPPAGRTRPTPGSRRAPAARWPSPTPGAGARRPACRRCRR